MKRGWGALAAVLLVGSGLAGAAPAAGVAGTGNYDLFDDNTLNATDGNGNEIPYTGATQIQYPVVSFDTAGFDVEDDEYLSGASNRNGCLKGPGNAVFAGRTGWLRFNPGVAGTINVLATTPTYDSVLMVREANEVTWGSANLVNDVGSGGCADQVVGPGNETVGAEPAAADKVYYIQVGSKCAGGPSTCKTTPPAGGPTSVRVIFTPSDGDGDGVPDTTDQCPGTPVGTWVNAAGCPDRDRDQIADAQDSCPDLPGIAADPPFNGCPAGPTPPGGSPRVTIVSATGDTLNTASTQVFLKLDWRQGTRQVLVDNAIGDPPKPVDFTQPLVPWTLPATSKSESRQVNVRFLGPGIDDSRTDTITLDTAPPDLVKSTVLPPEGGRWAVGFKTTDGKGGSGVASVTLLDRKKKAVSKPVKCRKSCATFLQSTPTRQQPRFALVVDRAGNRDVVKLSPAQRGCRVMVLAYDPPTARMCFRPGIARCEPGVTDAIWNFEQRNLVCTAAGRVIRRR